MSSPALKRTETSLQPLRLTLDASLAHSNARLRLAAAVLAGAAGLWLAWVEHAVWLRLTALASVLFAARWVMVFRKSARVTADAASHFLEITTQAVTLADGAAARTMPSDEIERIELDEDRLAVVLCLVGGEEVVIEPVYGSLGLRELGETLQRYIRAPATGGGGPGCTQHNP